MKNFILIIGVLLLILWVITFILYRADLWVHVTLAAALLVSVFGYFKMKRIGKV